MLDYNVFAIKALAIFTNSSEAGIAFESYPKLGRECQFLIKISHGMHKEIFIPIVQIKKQAQSGKVSAQSHIDFKWNSQGLFLLWPDSRPMITAR